MTMTSHTIDCPCDECLADHEAHIESLVIEALKEDKRTGGTFDLDGWGNFFLEDWKKDPEAVEDAWTLYRKLNHLI